MLDRDVAIIAPDQRGPVHVELGDPDGSPVVILEPPGSRGLCRAAHWTAVSIGVRLICVGSFGPSHDGTSRVPASAGGAAPLESVRIRIRSYGLLTGPGGIRYALAAAARYPEEVWAIGILDHCGQTGGSGMFIDDRRQLGRRLRAGWGLDIAGVSVPVALVLGDSAERSGRISRACETALRFCAPS